MHLIVCGYLERLEKELKKNEYFTREVAHGYWKVVHKDPSARLSSRKEPSIYMTIRDRNVLERDELHSHALAGPLRAECATALRAAFQPFHAQQPSA